MNILIDVLDTILRYAGMAYDFVVAYVSPFGFEIVIGLIMATFFLSFIYSYK